MIEERVFLKYMALLMQSCMVALFHISILLWPGGVDCMSGIWVRPVLAHSSENLSETPGAWYSFSLFSPVLIQ